MAERSRSLVRFEVTRLVRSPRGLGVSAALSGVVIASTWVGGAIAREHAELGVRDQAASFEVIEAAARAEDAGTTAYDLATSSGVFLARGVAPAAIFTADDLIRLPDAVRVRIDEAPRPVPATAERAPTSVLLGTLDLAWVLALLVPLAAIGLGYDALARDRERGLLALLLAGAPARAPLLWARAAAIGAVLVLGLGPATAVGFGLAALGNGFELDLVALLAVEVLVFGWSALWAATVTAVSALAARVATALTTLLAGWLGVCVALPLVLAALGRSALPALDPRARLEGERAAAEVMAKPSAARLDRQAELDPELDPSRGTSGIAIQNRAALLLSRERLPLSEGAVRDTERDQSTRVELAELTAWLSPSTLVTAALSAAAGTAPAERVALLADARAYRRALEAFVRARVLANEARFDRPELWPRPSRSPSTRKGAPTRLGLGLVSLAGLVLFWAGRRFERAELAPTREDA